MGKISFELRAKVSFGEWQRGVTIVFREVRCSVFMEGGRLFQRVGAVCWKERSEVLRVDICG